MAPLPDFNAYGDGAWGVWFNRIHSFEETGRQARGEGARTVHFPKSCLHCEDAACVTVCPTGASYKRAEDGIVLVNESICIGCKLCSWACPYGAREFDADEGVMKKCTLCIDRIYNENLAPEERQPACVMVCPTKARFFGDLGDPNSAGLRAGRDPRRQGSDAGTRLPPGQQIPAAAPQPARPRFRRRRSRAAPGHRDERAVALGRSPAVAIRGLVKRAGPADISGIAEFANCAEMEFSP